MWLVKLGVYLIILLNIISALESPSVIIMLTSFVLLYVGDLVPRKFISSRRVINILAASIIILGLFIEPEWMYYLPIAIIILYAVMGYFSLLLIILHMTDPNLILAVISVGAVTTAYLIEEIIRLDNENHEIRDRLTDDNLKLTTQKNELLHSHEKELEIASLNERNRIARDLHDAIGHSISSSMLMIESLQYVDDVSQLKTSLKDVQGRLETGMDDIRTSIHQLYSESLDLNQRLESLVANSRLNITYNNGVKSDLPYQLKLDILAIAKESLTNIQKHSNATRVDVTLHETTTNIILNIKDNGKNTVQNDYGMGLYSMKETVDKYKGIFHATMREDGFNVYVNIKKEMISYEDHNRR